MRRMIWRWRSISSGWLLRGGISGVNVYVVNKSGTVWPPESADTSESKVLPPGSVTEREEGPKCPLTFVHFV